MTFPVGVQKIAFPKNCSATFGKSRITSFASLIKTRGRGTHKVTLEACGKCKFGEGVVLLCLLFSYYSTRRLIVVKNNNKMSYNAFCKVFG